MDVTRDIDLDSIKYKDSLIFGSAFMNVHTALKHSKFFCLPFLSF